MEKKLEKIKISRRGENKAGRKAKQVPMQGKKIINGEKGGSVTDLR